MDLVDQIKGLKARSRSGHRRSSAHSTSKKPTAPDPHLLAERLGDSEISRGDDGCFLLRRKCLGSDVSASPVSPLLANVFGSEIPHEQVVVLDTETTGLAGGTGTVAFLIGLAHWQGDQLFLEQYFLPDHPNENLMLRRLQERLREFRVLVTFNGKTFDLPLLRTRWQLHRQAEVPGMFHLDLLHVSRRLFSHRLRGCGLANIEAHVLDRRREDDLPGRSAPRAFFRYLEEHDIDTMAGVFHHNADDLVSTATLLSRIGQFYAEPSSNGFGETGDWLGLAEWAEGIGDFERALEVFRLSQGVTHATGPRTKIELRMAELCRRTGREEEMFALLRSIADSDPLGGWPAVREIARWHEVREQWGEAFSVIDAAWARFEQVRSLRSPTGEARLPTAWRQWMTECEQMRDALRQASHEEQLTLPL